MLENISKKLSEYGQVIHDGSQNISDINSLKWQIESHENMIEEDYKKLGQCAYNKMKEEAAKNCPDIISRLDQKLAELENLKAELAQKNKEMSNLTGKWYCPRCKVENPKDAMYCSKCGTKKPMPETDKKIKYSEIKCPSCNAPLLEDSAFCAKCGYKIEK